MIESLSFLGGPSNWPLMGSKKYRMCRNTLHVTSTRPESWKGALVWLTVPCRLCNDADFFDRSQAMCQFFEIGGYPVFVIQAGHQCAQLIDRQSAFQTSHKKNLPTAFHSLSHFIPTTTQLNHYCLNDFKKIKGLALFFRNLHLLYSNTTKS